MPTPAPHGHGTNRLAPHRRFWPRRVPFDLPAAQTTLWDNLDISARRYPDKPAFVFFGRALSFAQLRAQAQRLAGWLHSKAGVREGDRVVLALQNSPQYVIAFYALLRLRAVIVPANPMSRGEEFAHYIGDSQARLAIGAADLVAEFERAQALLAPDAPAAEAAPAPPPEATPVSEAVAPPPATPARAAGGEDDEVFADLPKGSAQLDALCARGNADPVSEALCARPRIEGLADLQRALGLLIADPTRGNGEGGNPSFALLGHSTSLAGRLVSAINPRAFLFTSPASIARLRGPARRSPGFVAMGVTRGEQLVELVARDRRSDALRFFLVRFEQACNAGDGCSSYDLFSPAIERGWTGVSVYEDRDLANTVLDCGYTAPNRNGSRIPSSIFDLPWRILPRAFTAGQNENPTHATAEIQILQYLTGQSNTLTVTIRGVVITPTLGAGSNIAYAEEIATMVNDPSNGLTPYVYASASGSVVTLIAREPGANGNGLTVSLAFANPIAGNMAATANVRSGNSLPQTKVNFSGGVDVPTNGGNGNSIVSLTGMSERLPLGILVSDSDFLAENILGDGATSLRSYQGGLRAVYQNVPLTSNGFEYTRFLGEPGTELSMTDGSILQYVPYNPAITPGGTKAFRLYRGGGAAFVLSGVAPGGPVTWVGDSFSASVQPVLKGAVLACKAILVRNYHEGAFGTVRSEGDEIQMVVLTQALYGTPTTTEERAMIKKRGNVAGMGTDKNLAKTTQKSQKLAMCPSFK